MNKCASLLGTTLLLIGGITAARAQKGVGDPSGIARQTIRPEVITLTLEVIRVDSHPCKKTTGPAELGTHFYARGSGEKPLNIHLGPTDKVREIADHLVSGLKIQAEVFRTDKLPESHYVAKSLQIEEGIFQLRSADLRPFWAGDMPGRKRKRNQSSRR